MKRIMPLVLGLLLTMLLGCGTPAGPSDSPSGVTAQGALGRIDLHWNSMNGVLGYNVYRKTESTEYAKVNPAPLKDTSYTDTIASPEGDGVYYYYTITAITRENIETLPSAEVRSMHGTRLTGLPIDADGYLVLESILSPYVVDEGANLKIEASTIIVHINAKLYVLEGSTLDKLGAGTNYGLIIVNNNAVLKILGTAASPVTITAHGTGGASLPDGYGIALSFSAASSESTMRFARIEKLNVSGISVSSCSPVIEDCYFSTNLSSIPPAAYLNVSNGGPVISRCSFDRVMLSLMLGAAQPSLQIKNNKFFNNYAKMSITNSVSENLAAGQISSNSFLSQENQISFYKVTGTADVPLGGNYWGSSTKPFLNKDTGSTVAFDVVPMLTEEPTDVGPTW